MAARKQLWHPEEIKKRFYVYRIFDGMETVYVGKGSGCRLAAQTRRFGLPGEVIEECKSEDHAFQREIFWIAELRPTQNILKGGNGGRSRPKPIPSWIRKAEAEFKRFAAELGLVGSRRYVARFLLSKLDERNCESFGLSKVEIFRLREVANGPWC